MSDQDSREIVQLINLYAFAVDTQRWDLFDRIFTDGCEADFSKTAHWQDRASFKRDFGAFHAVFDSTQHIMSNHIVQVDGDQAQAFTYGTWRLIRRAAEGLPLWDGSGWYDDALVRTAEGWRIAKRTCRVVYWTGNPWVNDAFPGVKFELDSIVLRQEAEAGRVNFLQKLT